MRIDCVCRELRRESEPERPEKVPDDYRKGELTPFVQPVA